MFIDTPMVLRYPKYCSSIPQTPNPKYCSSIPQILFIDTLNPKPQILFIDTPMVLRYPKYCSSIPQILFIDTPNTVYRYPNGPLMPQILFIDTPNTVHRYPKYCLCHFSEKRWRDNLISRMPNCYTWNKVSNASCSGQLSRVTRNLCPF